MEGDVVVRPAGEADATAVRELMTHLDDVQRDWRVFPPRRGFQDEVLARYARQVEAGEALQVVAEVDGRIVGMAFGREHVVSRFSDARALEVSSVVVRPDARRRGIGRALLRTLAEEAVRRGIGHLNLHTFVQNDDAMRFWDSIGFAPRYVQLVATAEDILTHTR